MSTLSALQQSARGRLRPHQPRPPPPLPNRARGVDFDPNALHRPNTASLRSMRSSSTCTGPIHPLPNALHRPYPPPPLSNRARGLNCPSPPMPTSSTPQQTEGLTLTPTTLHDPHQPPRRSTTEREGSASTPTTLHDHTNPSPLSNTTRGLDFDPAPFTAHAHTLRSPTEREGSTLTPTLHDQHPPPPLSNRV